MKLSRLLVALLVMTFLAGTCLGQQAAAQPPVAGEENDEKKGNELREQTIYIPFDKLKTDDAMARLSRCRPIAGG